MTTWMFATGDKDPIKPPHCNRRWMILDKPENKMPRTALLTTSAAIGYMADTTAGTEINTPLGRIVFGSPFRAQDKMKDGQKVIGSDGQPVKVITFGVAIPRAEFEAQIWPAMYAEAARLFGTPPQGFKYKYKDGDSAEAPYHNGRTGTPYNQREGYPGHIVITISTELPSVSVMKFHNGAYHQIGANEIKTGDYVQMTLNIKAHAGQTPGLYINPVLVLLCYEGDAIAGSYEADPTQKFGAAPNIAPPPPGARQLGMPGAAPMAGMPGQQPMQGGMAPHVQQQSMQQPQGVPMGQPAMQPQPMGGMPGNGMGAGPAGAPPSYQTQPGQPGASAAPMSPSNGYPPPATDFIPGAQPMMQPQMGQPAPQGMPGQQTGGMPGMPGPR